LPFLLWGIFFRIVMGHHATWLVNSATHIWGSRRFETRDRSTNCWWVSLLTLGEGWHNNHHKYPSSAKQGLRWWELELSYLWIRALEKLGLVWSVRTAESIIRDARIDALEGVIETRFPE